MPYNPLAALEDTESGTTPNLMFPKDEILSIDHWVTFEAYETKQVSRRAGSTEEKLSSIRLPMPGNLTNAYNISYDDNDLGPMGQVLVDAFAAGGQEQAQSLRNAAAAGLVGGVAGAILGGDMSSFSAGVAAGVLTQTGIDPNLRGAAAGTVLGNLGGVGRSIVGNSGGLAVNPHRILLFNHVGFREHRFSYQLTPKNYEDANILRQIVRLFKLHASPAFAREGNINLSNFGVGLGTDLQVQDVAVEITGKHFFKYPEWFKISFHHPKFLYNIGPSVLENIVVDYHPAGSPTYARKAGQDAPTPTQINISLSFKETEIVTKENIASENR